MKEQTLTRGNILHSLLKFAVPVLLALFLQAMYGAADLIIVGKFAGTSEQSGVATGSQLFNLVTMAVTGLSMGITVFVGNAVGAGDKERAGQGIGTGIFIFGVLALIVTVPIVAGSEFLSAVMHAPESAFSATNSYIRICGIGTIFIVAYNLFGAIFRGVGDSATPLITVAIACAINIGGDLLLVGAFGMGAAGAAVATVAAQAVSVAVSFLLIRKKALPFCFCRRSLRPRADHAKQILLVGIPIALQEILVQLSFLFIQVIVNEMGVVASAAVGVAEKVCIFLMLVSSAYMQSVSAFVAQNNGAGLTQRSSEALLCSIATALIAGIAISLLALFGGALLSSAFSNEQAVITAAHSYLKAYAIDCLLTSVLFCFIGYFNGCKHTIFVMIQGVAGAFFVRIPVVYLMSRMDEATLFLIGLGTPVSSAVQIILCLAALLYFRKKEKNKEERLA